MGGVNSSEVYNEAITQVFYNNIGKNTSFTEIDQSISNYIQQNVQINITKSEVLCSYNSDLSSKEKTVLYNITDITTDVEKMDKMSTDIYNDLKEAITQANRNLTLGQENSSKISNIISTLSSTTIEQIVSVSFRERMKVNDTLIQKQIMIINESTVDCKDGPITLNQFGSRETYLDSIASNIMKSKEITDIINKMSDIADTEVSQKNDGIDIVAGLIAMAVLGMMFMMMESGGMGAMGSILKFLLPVILIVVAYFMWKSEKYHKYVVYVLVVIGIVLFYEIGGFGLVGGAFSSSGSAPSTTTRSAKPREVEMVKKIKSAFGKLFK